MTPEQQKEIINRESAWIDQNFGQLDLSAFPALNELPPEDKHDDRFARDWRDTALSASATALRDFVQNPDADTLQRVGEETNNPYLLNDVADQRAEKIVMQFKMANPEYVPTQQNYAAIIRTLAYNSDLTSAEQAQDVDTVSDLLIQSGYFTPRNLQAVFDALQAEGLLDVPLGQPRNLTTAERLRVSRLAQSGKPDQAIGFYIESALDGEIDLEILDDPEYRPVCDSAVWEVWQDMTPDYTPTPSREAFIRRHCGKRPLTIQLMNAAWAALKRHEEGHARSALLQQLDEPKSQPVTEHQLDALSDDAVDSLYHSTLGEYARNSRHRPGVIA